MLNFFRQNSESVRSDLLSGITVALALVPEAIAFAFLLGVSPLIGLYSAAFVGLIAAVCGGRPGMISGATGAMAVVVIGLVSEHGIEYLFPAVMLCGVFQVLAGLFGLGKLIRMVPHSVELGFVNGLAIVIGLAQLGSFKTLSGSGELVYLSGSRLAVMLVLVAITMAIIWLLPKLTRAVPASLAAIVVVTILSLGINHNVEHVEGQQFIATVGDMLRTNLEAAENSTGHGSHHSETDTSDESTELVVTVTESDAAVSEVAVSEELATVASSPNSAEGISGSLPLPFFLQYEMVPLTLETFWIILPFSIVLCGVGLIESLMTLSLIDEITQTRGQGNRECLGQGAANLFCGLMGGMGGCAMIGQSLINVNSGGRGRLSGVAAAVALLIFVLFLGPLIEQISMAALVGVMFMVVIGTFEWASIKMFEKMPTSDVLVMVLVTTYTVVMHDLATAVILGIVVSALVFAWKHSTHIFADVKFNQYGSKIYQLHGPLFFASVTSFKELFDFENDPDDVVIDFYYTRVYDQSALEAINSISEKYDNAGKRLHLTHLSSECRQLLDRAGEFVEVNVSEDPHYHVATDRLA
ncbi:C4-dicarboxylic acid transporter DauA [Thalassoglobus neptunius]|uniref:C4-dicarboxylic acid transporter DauA n=1 Tax=Thalassoglobus neptunius TaxID=1938619 RepID=A0A5C5V902_9PLAN|nr:SulP family inorganic anion transporter [Thalassoglobus neptunius]TWT35076.1 C4-dicarboxylic acid transporter DauA [Thalassoglobus neptunius]